MPSTTKLKPAPKLTWLAKKQLVTTDCPGSLLHWLLNKDSLTERLVARSRGEFHVEVLAQYRAKAQQSEYAAMHIKRQRYCFIREVVLFGNNQPWVFARTVVPLQTMTGRLRALGSLNNKPLGAFLFSFPTMRRGVIEFANIRPDHQLVPTPFFANSDSLWGRRSVFFLDNKPLLVNEIFLPGFIDNLERKPI